MRQALTMMQIEHQNPDASMPLWMPVLVLPNTPPAEIDANVRANSRRRDLQWLECVDAHDGVAVIVGGGPSIEGEADKIHWLKGQGGRVFSMNGTAKWLAQHDVTSDYHVLVDAQTSTKGFAYPNVGSTLCASAVNPGTLAAAKNPMLFHLNFDGIEKQFPRYRVKRGGYSLLGGGVSVGITTLVVAWALGYRRLHIFGYDSCNSGKATHAYDQPQNTYMPTIDVEWAGKTFTAGLAMKLQAEAFIKFAAELVDNGCELTLYGEGLLQSMYMDEPWTEREKYQKIWAMPGYRQWSPGEHAVDQFLEVAKPDGLVIDFGCGTGRAALKILEKGDVPVMTVDFVDNSRDMESGWLPFLQHDLTEPIPLTAAYGFCTDVMEHIPPAKVMDVVENIMASVPRCFFQIATVGDGFGAAIGARLHLSVHQHSWWHILFDGMGFKICWEETSPMHSSFYIERAGDV